MEYIGNLRFAILLFFGIFLSQCQGQTCNVNSIQVQNDFDAFQFTGRWYYARMLHFSFLPDIYSDLFVQYTQTREGFNVQWWARILGLDDCQSGSSTVYSTNTKGKYLVTQQVNATYSINATNWVISTDYANYALLYGCAQTNFRGECTDPGIVMWTRSRQPDSSHLAAMQNLLSGLCLGSKVDDLVDIEQDQECFTACDKSPCMNGATCNDWQFAPGYYCWCLQGYTGFNCSNRVLDESTTSTSTTPGVSNACVAQPCVNGATCLVRDDYDVGYECRCARGYRGSRCEESEATDFRADCPLNPCFYGASCKLNSDEDLAYTCVCRPGTSGQFCRTVDDEDQLDNSLCVSNPCGFGATCLQSRNTQGYICICAPGYSGDLCNIDDNRAQRTPCMSRPCQNGAICIDVSFSEYLCNCTSNFVGTTCEERRPDPCDRNRCMNGATCVNVNLNNYRCTCTDDYEGSRCDVYRDPCDSRPCLNNAFCNRLSGSNFECQCAAGYSGSLCDVIQDPCRNQPCLNGGLCTPNGINYICICSNGFSGRSCQDTLNPCDARPCENGGTCTVSGRSYYCTCLPSFRGSSCNERADPCASRPCQNAGTCTSNGDFYFCSCRPNFSGPFCQNRISDPCERRPCLNGGSCVPDGLSFYCTCLNGFNGSICETPAGGVCGNSPCMNSGTCVPTGSSFFCQCRSEYRGARCEARVMPCDSFPCRNAATCTNDGSNYICSCSNQWTGRTCNIFQPTLAPTPAPTPAPTTPGSGGRSPGADIAFVIDTSSSVTDYNFRNRILPFIVQIVESLDIGQRASQVGIVTFNTQSRIVIELDDYSDRQSLINAIRSLPYNGRSATNISGSVWLTRTELFNRRNSDRAGFPKLAIFIIDGDSSSGGNDLGRFSRQAHREGIAMFPIGIGGWVRQSELAAIATDPDSDNILRIRNFNDLRNVTTREFIFDKLNRFGGQGQGGATGSQGTGSQGTGSQGTGSQGTGSQGTGSQGTGSQGTGPTGETDNNTPGTRVWECGFEASEQTTNVNRNVVSWCGMRQSSRDQMDWSPSRADGRTPSSETGPDSAFTGRGYAYLEASNKRENDQCILLLPVTDYRGAYCLKIAYHMFGYHIRRLEVNTIRRNGAKDENWKCEVPIRERTRNWRVAHVQLNIKKEDEVEIVGVRGREFSGDIAIDDLSLTKGSCNSATNRC